MEKQESRCGFLAPERPGRLRLRAQVLATCLLLAALAGCSLVSLKSPERPLSTRDLNSRMLTRELALGFIGSVGRCAQEISASEHDPAVLDNTLRWELSAVSESRRAATRAAPMMSLLDTWALALQLQAFTAEGGAGGTLFGAHQQAVREIDDRFAADMQALARSLLGAGEFADAQRFVGQYARRNPLRDLGFERASIVALWSREKGAAIPLVDTLGTVPQAMADASQRLQIYGDTMPAQAMRRTELALRQAGYGGGDLRAALERLDERMRRLDEVAEQTPQLVRGAEEDVRQSLHEVLERLDATTRTAAETLHGERIALFADLDAQREALAGAIDAQRRALASDAARISGQVVKDAGTQVRALARELLLLLILLSAVVLGLPFAAGYLLGRARRNRRGT
jgi:hypothetical protein